jgi:peptidoglycan/LPS O-acetylase OafA/YrhL
MGIRSYSLTKEDSSILKGFAICGMLCWHLFYCDNPVGRQFSEFTRFIGMVGDVCVSLFLFVSGYGMSYTMLKADQTGGGKFVKEVLLRLIKFYFSYWPVFLIMLAIGVFIFHIPLVEDDTSILHIAKVFVMNFLGLSAHHSYNATWWYNSLIIPLYVLSPLFYLCLKRMPILTIIMSVVSVSVQFRVGCDLARYLFIYLIGMTAYLYIDRINSCLNNLRTRSVIALTIVLLLLFAFSLKIIGDPIYSRGIYSYAAITILLAVFTKTIATNTYLRLGINFIGKHSANIYLCHTLIFYYWFPDFFYSIRFPFFIFLSLLFISLLVSMFFEQMKKRIGINSLQRIIVEKIMAIS